MVEPRPYFNDRLIEYHTGFVIITPVDREPTPPLFCPVCSLLMRNSEDITYWKIKTCCQKCGFLWADSRLEEWSRGWRPDPKDIAIEVKRRQSLPLSLILTEVEIKQQVQDNG